MYNVINAQKLRKGLLSSQSATKRDSIIMCKETLSENCELPAFSPLPSARLSPTQQEVTSDTWAFLRQNKWLKGHNQFVRARIGGVI